MKTKFEDFYREQYNDDEFRKTYLSGRHRVYERIASILRRLRVQQVFDIGCSYGLLVERLNQLNIDAYGADLPLDELKEFHQKLPKSRGKFFYGNAVQTNFPVRKDGSAIVILDCLRHFDNAGILGDQAAEYIVIKENGSRSRLARSRDPQDQVRFYSPSDLLEVFPSYEMREIHFTRYLFRLSHPNIVALKAFDYLPSYTAVLQRRSASSK